MATHKRNPKNQAIIVKIDPELAELIPGFLENRENDIRLMHQALREGDYEIIERIGHGMKGAGGGFGFETITEIGLAIEEAAKQKDPAGIQKGMEALSYYVQRLEVIYE